MAALDNHRSWVGRTIDQYQVLSLVGAGGMGVVYRARDTKLGRDIALKVLPEEYSHDPERVVRLEREARLLASLNHPNIAAIYDLKESETNRCLILEYVDGETLAERANRGPLSLDDALKISQQISEALRAAHGAGIVHRDIKPANIKVTTEGRVKVLDFGLAKSLGEAQELSSSMAPTLVTQMRPHALLGTPAYMSPEQMRGELVDRRADIWAFGCVLFELLAGRPTFSASSIPEIIASVLKSDPDWSRLPQHTPAIVLDFLRSCLEKDAMRRLSDLAGVSIQTWTPAQDSVVTTGQPCESPVRSIAVLPFVNAGGNPEMDYLGDGLTESIIYSLSQLSELHVMARSTVFRYKGRSDEAQQCGRELGVAVVLTGRVLQRNETLVISVELVDVENGWQLWGEQYRRKSADIFTIEEDIAREIAEKLRLKLTPGDKKCLSRRYTENVEAYHLYLKGKFHWGKRTAEGLNRGIQYFRQAIEGDPTYALAYAGLAEGYMPLGIYCHMAPKEAFTKARSAAEKALEIDPQLAEAQTVLASVKQYLDWDLIGAEKGARAVIQLDPKYPRARQILADCLVQKHQVEEALDEVRRALDLDPLSLHMNAALTMTCYFARRFDLAVESGRRTTELDPNFFPGYFYLGLAFGASGQHAEAVGALQQATALSSNSTLMLAALGGAFAVWGKEEEAREILQKLEEMGKQKYVSQVFVAAIYAALQEKNHALTSLEQAYEDRCSWLPRCLMTDQRLDSLRNEPRFLSLVRRVGGSQT